MGPEKTFNKYKTRGSMHWQEMRSRDPRRFNAYQQGRYGWIIKRAGDLQGKSILDLGCGDGSLSYLMAKAGAKVIGADNEKQGIEFAKENLRSTGESFDCKFVEASAYSLPFAEDSFDMVVSCEVIEHLQEPERMLEEVGRVLKSGGIFILTTPYRLTEEPKDPNHVKEYFPGEIKSMLEKFFPVSGVKPTHHVLWYSLYTYAVRSVGNRPLGRWIINIPAILFGWNPFMIKYDKLTKFDRFTTILAWGEKK